jgi:hypothetical protein
VGRPRRKAASVQRQSNNGGIEDIVPAKITVFNNKDGTILPRIILDVRASQIQGSNINRQEIFEVHIFRVPVELMKQSPSCLSVRVPVGCVGCLTGKECRSMVILPVCRVRVAYTLMRT